MTKTLFDILPQEIREMIASHVLDGVSLAFLAHKSLTHYAPAGFVAGWKPAMRNGNHVIFQLLCKRLGWEKPLPPDSTWSQHYNLLAGEVLRTVLFRGSAEGPEANYERMIRGKPFDVSIANAALYENAPTLMKILFHHSPEAIKWLPADGVPLLSRACHRLPANWVKLLLDAGADPNGLGCTTQLNRWGRRFPHMASSPPLMHLCMWPMPKGREAFHEEEKRRVEIAKMLLDAGADVNAVNIEGESALFLAACYPASTALLEVLLLRGADVRIRDFKLRGLIEILALYGPIVGVDYRTAQRRECRELLLKAGAPPPWVPHTYEEREAAIPVQDNRLFGVHVGPLQPPNA